MFGPVWVAGKVGSTKPVSPGTDMSRLKAFNILGLKPGNSFKKVKSAYFKLCLEHHPDHTAHLSRLEQKRKQEKFLLIQQAYEQLKAAEHSPFQPQPPVESPRVNPSTTIKVLILEEKSSPQFRNSMQYLAMGFFVFFVFNHLLIRRQEKNVERQRQFGWAVHSQRAVKEEPSE
jgi:hypothetical protein